MGVGVGERGWVREWWEGCFCGCFWEVMGDIMVDFVDFCMGFLYFEKLSGVVVWEEVGGPFRVPLSFLLGRVEEEERGDGVGALKNISSEFPLRELLMGVARGEGWGECVKSLSVFIGLVLAIPAPILSSPRFLRESSTSI